MLKKINYISFKKGGVFPNFWKNTTYYNASIESIVRKKLIKEKTKIQKSHNYNGCFN